MVLNEKLSSKEYWDEVLQNTKLPILVKNSEYGTWLQDVFFEEFISGGNYSTLMEVGAGSSGWLPYLAKKYHLHVSGLDYSEIGCEICKRNLEYQGISYEKVICEDVFNWGSDDTYDIIISFGVIEHFENPERILDICRRHLNKGGLVITVVPNLKGFPGRIVKNFLPEVYKMHQVIDLKQLNSVHQMAGFTEIKSNYTGLVYPLIFPWSSKKDGFFFRESSITRKLTLFFIDLLNLFTIKVLRFFRINPSSEALSPFVIYIGRI
jgi:2-polyprenyl-3-methyl-5-hydroxy-6-metoxy-1,4-benzoquinol methylase